jgi:hypothetical protein
MSPPARSVTTEITTVAQWPRIRERCGPPLKMGSHIAAGLHCPLRSQPPAVQDVLRRIRLCHASDVEQAQYWNWVLGRVAWVAAAKDHHASNPYSPRDSPRGRANRFQDEAGKVPIPSDPRGELLARWKAREYRNASRNALQEQRHPTTRETALFTERKLTLLEEIEQDCCRPHCNEVTRLLTLFGGPTKAGSLRALRLQHGRQRKKVKDLRSNY